MVEALAGIIVFFLAIAGIAAVGMFALTVFTILATGIYWLFAWPFPLYRWWKERREKEERLVAWREEEIRKLFAHEARLQNGPESW